MVTSDVNGEWFEITNLSNSEINLNGLIIKDDGTDVHVISDNDLILSPNEFLVLGSNNNMESNGNVNIDYQYSNFSLSNLWDETNTIKASHPWLRLQTARRREMGDFGDFEKVVSSCALTIHTVNETTYLQCIANNIPTIVYFDKVNYQVKDSQAKYFKKLEDAKILFYDVKELAQHVNRIHLDVNSWWSSNITQLAVKDFTNALAWTDENWIEGVNDYFLSKTKAEKVAWELMESKGLQQNVRLFTHQDLPL